MKDKHVLLNLKKELSQELHHNIMPFWLEKVTGNAEDGFVSRITCDNQIVPDADKGVILYARMLWSYSAWYTHTGNKQIAERAEQVFRYFNRHFWDHEQGGVYWAIDAKGEVKINRKYMYAQAFALYGYSEYYNAFGDSKALKYAQQLFIEMENRAFDEQNGGYFEVFNRTWQLYKDNRLSNDEKSYPKSTNTHLHILEAYSNLLKYWEDDRLKDKLKQLILLFENHIARPGYSSLCPFFGYNWQPKTDTLSFGHDIEAAWLLCEAVELITDDKLDQDVKTMCLQLSRWVLEHGVNPDGSLINEQYSDGSIDHNRHWWPQAEALVGFLNAYELSEDRAYLEACKNVWAFIKHTMRDNTNGEWHNSIHEDGINTGEDKVNFWKAPYHNSRAALETITRVEKMMALKTLIK